MDDFMEYAVSYRGYIDPTDSQPNFGDANRPTDSRQSANFILT